MGICHHFINILCQKFDSVTNRTMDFVFVYEKHNLNFDNYNSFTYGFILACLQFDLETKLICSFVVHSILTHSFIVS